MNTLKKLLLSLSIASMGFVAHVRADDSVEAAVELAEDTSFVEQITDIAHDIVDDVQDLANLAVDQAQEVAEDVIEDTRSLMGQYQNMILRAALKSAVEVGGNGMGKIPVKYVPGLVANKAAHAAPNAGQLAKIYVDLAKIAANTSIDELVPQNADASIVQNMVETFVPTVAGQVIANDFAAKQYASYAALALALSQKALSKGLFVKTEGLTQRAIQAADFVLSCVDTKAVSEIDTLDKAKAFNTYFALHKGIAKFATKKVMDAIVKKAVSDAQVTSKATREKALADFFQAILVKPVCEAGVAQAFAK